MGDFCQKKGFGLINDGLFGKGLFEETGKKDISKFGLNEVDYNKALFCINCPGKKLSESVKLILKKKIRHQDCGWHDVKFYKDLAGCFL